MSRDYVALTLNGKPLQVRGEYVFRPLSDFLRYANQLTGTKVVCAEGDCGACTIMTRRAGPGRQSQFRAINSCIFPTFLADALHIVTVEGLKQTATDGSDLGEIQQAMVRNDGGQCGFCTPGFVMAIANLVESKSDYNRKHAQNYLTGNLCRCTGYAPILNAVMDIDQSKVKRLSECYGGEETEKWLEQQTSEPLHIKHENQEIFAPKFLEDACEFRATNNGCRIFSGATDIGVQINKGKRFEDQKLSLHLVEELYECDVDKDTNALVIGARATLDQIQEVCEGTLPELAEFLNLFASPQIKNSGTLIGNLANASPIADTTPMLLALDATVCLANKSQQREVKLTDFFKSYKVTELNSDEIITQIKIPLPKPGYKMKTYKISQRRDLDISCVNACFISYQAGNKISSFKAAFGGVAGIPLRLPKLEQEMQNKSIDGSTESSGRSVISKSITPLSDVRGTAEFRTEVAKNLYSRFLREELGLG